MGKNNFFNILSYMYITEIFFRVCKVTKIMIFKHCTHFFYVSIRFLIFDSWFDYVFFEEKISICKFVHTRITIKYVFWEMHSFKNVRFGRKQKSMLTFKEKRLKMIIIITAVGTTERNSARKPHRHLPTKRLLKGLEMICLFTRLGQ